MNRNVKNTITFKTFEFSDTKKENIPNKIAQFISDIFQGTTVKKKYGLYFFDITLENVILSCRLSFLPHEHPYEIRYSISFEPKFSIKNLFKSSPELTNQIMNKFHENIYNTNKIHNIRWFTPDTTIFMGDDTKGFSNPLDILNKRAKRNKVWKTNCAKQ